MTSLTRLQAGLAAAAKGKRHSHVTSRDPTGENDDVALSPAFRTTLMFSLWSSDSMQELLRESAKRVQCRVPALIGFVSTTAVSGSGTRNKSARPLRPPINQNPNSL